MPEKPLLIVDGYNLLRSGGVYNEEGVDDYDHDPMNSAREKVIADVATYAQNKFEAIVVFDGGGNELSDGKPTMQAGIKVVFSPAHTDADQMIERLVFKARKDEREVLVVSSDWDIQNTTFKDGVTRMSAIGFVHEMDVVTHEYVDSSHNYSKHTLADRLDASTKAKLEALIKSHES